MGTEALPTTPFFPAGLFAASLPSDQAVAFYVWGAMGLLPSFVGWTIYGSLIFAMWRVKRKTIFLCLYALLCLLLSFNVEGCRKLISAVGGIH
jgi:hypothetical protein